MVVATFKPGTHMPDVFAVVPEEQERVRQLQAEGRINTVYLATAARQTVFLESFGIDIDDVLAMVNTLPMAKWWNIDVFPLNPPAEVPEN
jgi:muconolactone delta-isomerase